MRDIFIVAKFTIKDMLHKKAFIISTLVIMAMIIVGCNIPNIIKAVDEGTSEEDVTILLKDSDNTYEGYITDDLKVNGYIIQMTNLSIDSLKEKIEDEEIDSVVVASTTEDGINFKYIVKDALTTYSIPEEVKSTLVSVYEQKEIIKLGLTEEELKGLYPNVTTELEAIGNLDEVNVLLMMMLSVVLFFAIYYTAFQVSSSITLEKTSKIIETIATSTSPTCIILGKTLGMAVTGVLQLIVIIATALISANLFVEKELLETLLDVTSITWGLGILAVVYFILGYLVYAFLYALTGATVSKPEDVQSANGPVSILAVIGFYLAYFTMMNPTSSLNRFASLFPLSSAFCMPFRYMMHLASISDITLSIFILIITISLVAFVSIRIYTNAILNYGTRLSVKDLVKIFKQK